MQKKTYSKPQLVVHGNVEAITQQGTSLNKDTPNGNTNTAFNNLS